MTMMFTSTVSLLSIPGGRAFVIGSNYITTLFSGIWYVRPVVSTKHPMVMLTLGVVSTRGKD